MALLPRATVFAIALLAAFLTVVQVWQIPPPDRNLTHSPGKPETEQAPAATVEEAQKRLALSFFGNNFARTVLGGLVGMLAVSFIDSFWKDASFWGSTGVGPQAYYLVLFIAFFLVILVVSSLLRGAGEALRSRVLIYRPFAGWPPPLTAPTQPAQPDNPKGPAVNPANHRLHTFWHWLSSFRTTFLVFSDTAFHFLQGQNQMQTEVFEGEIVKMHWSMYWAAERIREEIDRAVVTALKRGGKEPSDESAVRVSISLLSADQKSVSYISRERGSLGQAFGQRSLAWVTIFTGKPLWYKDPEYGTMGDIVIHENSDRSIPGEEGKLLLGPYLQVRAASDYKGFVVIPFPPAHRGKDLDHRRGGIHISFKEAAYMNFLWGGLENTKGEPNYGAPKDLLLRLDGSVIPPSPTIPAQSQQQEGFPEAPESLRQLGEANQDLKGYLEKLNAYRTRLNQDREALVQKSQEIAAQVHALEQSITGNPQPPDNQLRILDPELRAVLHESLEVLGELFTYFSDSVFEDYIRPRLRY